jgi:hypothetical protein
MKKLHVFRALFALAAVAVLTNSALAGYVVPADANLLFADNFYYAGGVSLDLNAGIDSSDRISGSLAGQVSYDTANMVGNKDIDGLNNKIDLSDGGLGASRACVGLTKDFNNDLAQGGLIVMATLCPRGGVNTLSVGNTGSAPASIGDTYLDGANYYKYPGFYGCVFDGVTIAANLGVTAFLADGTAQNFSDFIWNGGYNDYAEVALVCTDAEDHNPFNGSGTLTVDMYVNGTFITSGSAPDLAHNYIGIQAVAYGTYASVKDVRVYQTPEPGTLALLAAAAGLACVWFRRRR